jgi:DNA polymerase-3 subunit alpha
MKDFVHLHLHTVNSILDGMLPIDKLFEKAKEFNMPAVAMTDHGNLFGAVDFFSKAKEVGIKPIIGMEAYMAADSIKNKSKESITHHLVLLAKNKTGYKNLCILMTAAYRDGFYRYPRIDKELLKQHHEGLIGLSACLKGEIPYNIYQHYLNNDDSLYIAEEKTMDMLNIFKDDFYLEIQHNKIPEQDIINSGIIKIGKKLGVGVVATNDCHYLEKEDSKAHDTLLCVQTKTTIYDTKRLKFNTDELFFKSRERMEEDFKDYSQEVLDLPVEIAKKVDFSFDFGTYHFPAVTDTDKDINDVFEKAVRDGFQKRVETNEKIKNNIDVYKKRLDMEIDVIKKSQFAAYFMIVSDFMTYAKDNGVETGPGRGSAAGSLVAYAMRITEIDPIEYDLMFERFLNPERVSMPDIDCDFADYGRDKVIKYVSDKYGKDNVAQIVSFGMMKAKNTIKDVARAIDDKNKVGFNTDKDPLSFQNMNKITKLIDDAEMSISDVMNEMPEFVKEIDKHPEYKEVIEISKKIENSKRHPSMHAAGVVIGDMPLQNLVPFYIREKKDINNKVKQVNMVAYDMKAVEKLGLIKFDFLGISTLTVIRRTAESVGLDIKNIPIDDEKTMELLRKGDTTGVFQLESDGMKNLVKALQPKTFKEIIPLVALYRPGPLNSGMVDMFVKAKNSTDGKIEDPEGVLSHEKIKPIVSDTYGVMLYQEQIMRIAVEAAGFSMGEADKLRKGIGKKDMAMIEKMGEHFISGCKGNNISEEKAEKLFGMIKKFGEYGFNKSHSASYAYMAYITAYLKTHYRTHYVAQLLSLWSNNAQDQDKVTKLWMEEKNNIKFLPVNINMSDKYFTVPGKNTIRVGLLVVKTVGEDLVDAIITERNKKQFDSVFDFVNRMQKFKLNSRAAVTLANVGAFDSFYMLPLHDRLLKRTEIQKEILETLEVLKKTRTKEKAAATRKAKKENQPDLFDGDNDE